MKRIYHLALLAVLCLGLGAWVSCSCGDEGPYGAVSQANYIALQW